MRILNIKKANAKIELAKDRKRNGMTLVELLIVIAIIGILLAIFLPAVQAIRSRAHKTSCGNKLKQMGVAMQAYETAHQKYPSGFVWPDKTLWHAFLLPFVEENNIYQTLEFGSPYDSGSNSIACATSIDLFLCSSAGDPDPNDFEGIDNRKPSTYLAVATGIADQETGTGKLVGATDLDGCFFNNSQIVKTEIADGISSTLMIGESLFLQDVSGIDNEGDSQVIDHWYIGSTDNLPEKNASEAIGSTAVPINAFKNASLHIERKEVAFSSNHGPGAQFVFMDGHVDWLAESIDAALYSGLGTRNGSEIIPAEY